MTKQSYKGLLLSLQQKQEKAWQKVIKYKEFLGAEESIQTLILQEVEEPFLEALKEEYIGYGRRTPFKMIEYLRTKISKVTNKDKI